MAGRRFLEKCSVKTKKHLSDKESVKKDIPLMMDLV